MSEYFGVWDWLIFSAMVVVSLGIGIFYAIRGARSSQASTTDYLLGGRKMGMIPVSISILVSYLSGILILGTPAEIYTEGTMFCLNLIGVAIALTLSTVLFVPLLYPLRLTSSLEVTMLFNFIFILAI